MIVGGKRKEMKFSKQQTEDTIITKDMLESMAKQEFIEFLTSQYKQYQKNIQPIWVGEGWYKSVPNSFNYFVGGFEAGMKYAKEGG
jgi:hypothetical protein